MGKKGDEGMKWKFAAVTLAVGAIGWAMVLALFVIEGSVPKFYVGLSLLLVTFDMIIASMHCWLGDFSFMNPKKESA